MKLFIWGLHASVTVLSNTNSLPRRLLWGPDRVYMASHGRTVVQLNVRCEGEGGIKHLEPDWFKQTNKQASNKNHRYTSAVECLPSLSKAMCLILSIAGIKDNNLNMLIIYFSWEPYLGSSQMVPLSYTQNPSFC